jgi:hypothetical protein
MKRSSVSSASSTPIKWHLDDRPLADDKEINPDVLGYIFEKYINQKQMGAYYTKEDITGYIARNTIVPFLLDAAAKACPAAFAVDGPVWRLLRDDPDKYIYAAVRQGVDVPLPDAVAAGVADVKRRDGWNRPAAQGFALPTETWREHIARRQRCHELRRKMRDGEVCAVNDLITHNLDICQFAEDVLDSCDDPELLRAVWHAVENVSVLDPTCGSGAFLFAALNILEPLYEACLERMEAFLAESEHTDFRQILDRVAQHPSRQYFIYKSSIIHNLYGVDIMKEAVEICKLRLFLKLVSQVRRLEQLEPLPDIDFNIRAGNTLVGFASLQELENLRKTRLGFDTEEVQAILDQAKNAERDFTVFRQLQLQYGPAALDYSEAKQGLQTRLTHLRNELDRYLAAEYGVDADKPKAFEKWHENHKPFHWFAEFYGIVTGGGFDVIIGNPPYVEYSKLRGEYKLLDQYKAYSTNLYSACCFRSTELKAAQGRASFIVPVSLPSTDRMEALRIILGKSHTVHHVSFSTRPSKLFDGAEQRLTIYVQSPSQREALFSGGYLKWCKEERKHLFDCVFFIESGTLPHRRNIWPKVRDSIEKSLLGRIKALTPLEQKMLGAGSTLYYKNTGLRYFNTVTLDPPKCWINGKPTSSSRETVLDVEPQFRHIVHTVLLSSTFFMYYQFLSNCRDLNPTDISTFPVPDLSLCAGHLDQLSVAIERDYREKGRVLRMNNKLTGLVELESVTPARSKELLDEIDRVLAQHYGFSDEELDFILNYDIKYRMGQDSGDG